MELLLKILSHWDGAVAVLLVLGGLIFFHELGHFSMARAFGIGVRTFSLGFGPKIFTRRRGKTDYCLSLIPLGGYVSLAGEDGEEVPNPQEKDEVSFHETELFSQRPAWQRLLVVLAGPVANFVLALMLCWGLAWVQGQQYLFPEVGQILPGSPAERAGIQSNDMIKSIDGLPIKNWEQVIDGIGASQGKPVTFILFRNGEERTLTITPEAKTRPNIFGEEKPAWLVGFTNSGKMGYTPLKPLEAIVVGTQETWKMIALTGESFVKLVQRVVPLDNVGGPILIAQMIGQQAEQGIAGVLVLAALISVNLGILNLLPIPVLDGGHIVFFTLEMLLKRPLSIAVQTIAARVGMALLLCLMLLATWNDLKRLFS